MPLSSAERDVLIGDFLASRFQSVPSRVVRDIAFWALFMNCGDSSDQQLIERWQQLEPGWRSESAAVAVSRVSAEVAQ